MKQYSGIIDLYQKEKEKNNELNRLKGFEMLDIFNIGKESSRKRIKHDWVEKDKIKVKIEELEKQQKENRKSLYRAVNLLNNYEIDKYTERISVNLSLREYLQELLKE